MDRLSSTNHPAMFLSHKQMEEILADINLRPDEERCGLIGGEYLIVHKVYPITNCLHSPTRFRMEAQEQVNALLDIEHHGWELIAVYHSHPNGPGEPSETDTKEYAYPGVYYIIVNRLAERKLRAFRFEDGQWYEIPIEVGEI